MPEALKWVLRIVGAILFLWVVFATALILTAPNP